MSYAPRVNATLTVRMDEETLRRLEAEARRTGRSKGELVREALRECFGRRGPSALDALGDLVGIMSGPVDLSTNKAHLANLGRRRRRR